MSSVIAPEVQNNQEVKEDKALRPKTLSEYVGQAALRKQLDVYVKSAKLRNAVLDHTILSGPPGLGKTTLAQVIANELGVNFKVTAGNIIEKPAELASILTQLSEGDVLFIDEIHRLPAAVEEILYPAMEDFKLDIVIGNEGTSKVVSVPLPQFTLIGATTMAGSLSQPLRDRFGIQGVMQFYTHAELESIAVRSAALMGQDIDTEAAKSLATRARGTPRIVNRMLRRVRDFAVVHGSSPGRITTADALGALDLLNIDATGLDSLDQRILTLMGSTYKGRPVGLDTLAAAVGESAETIESAVEPYLLQRGLIMRTPRGRVLTESGEEYLTVAKPAIAA